MGIPSENCPRLRSGKRWPGLRSAYRSTKDLRFQVRPALLREIGPLRSWRPRKLLRDSRCGRAFSCGIGIQCLRTVLSVPSSDSGSPSAHRREASIGNGAPTPQATPKSERDPRHSDRFVFAHCPGLSGDTTLRHNQSFTALPYSQSTDLHCPLAITIRRQRSDPSDPRIR